MPPMEKTLCYVLIHKSEVPRNKVTRGYNSISNLVGNLTFIAHKSKTYDKWL